jgi:hypothetical protein
MGSSVVGASTTAAVDTSRQPRFAYANRYSWSTFGGTTASGALVYRPTDNCLYKLDNTNSSSGTFQKWSLTTNSATSLNALYNTMNPIDQPWLTMGTDTNIYCLPTSVNTTTYNMNLGKYVVSTNTWSNPSGTGVQYSHNLVNAPAIPSTFTNPNDVVFVGGHFGSGGSVSVQNYTNLLNTTVSVSDDTTPSATSGVGRGTFTEIKNGDDIICPTGGYFMSTHPSNYTTTSPGIARVQWQITNPRTNSALVLNYKTPSNWARKSTYGDDRYFGSSMVGTQNRNVCIESRWILTTPYAPADVFDLKTGDTFSPIGFGSVHSNGTSGSGTNMVYISATKKLYFHATDNYLYEYNVTFE